LLIPTCESGWQISCDDSFSITAKHFCQISANKKLSQKKKKKKKKERKKEEEEE
jgi:hypothetical protein